jgi:ribosomal protein S19E (S16A)
LINKNKKYKEILHYIGQIDKKSNIIYTNRNSFFEPYTAPDKDWVDICMSGVKRAIDLKKPIIIGSHRINYVGRLDTKHRDKNLKTLKLILKQIVKHYPDVEFIDSGQLADIIY